MLKQIYKLGKYRTNLPLGDALTLNVLNRRAYVLREDRQDLQVWHRGKAVEIGQGEDDAEAVLRVGNSRLDLFGEDVTILVPESYKGGLTVNCFNGNVRLDGGWGSGIYIPREKQQAELAITLGGAARLELGAVRYLKAVSIKVSGDSLLRLFGSIWTQSFHLDSLDKAQIDAHSVLAREFNFHNAGANAYIEELVAGKLCIRQTDAAKTRIVSGGARSGSVSNEGKEPLRLRGAFSVKRSGFIIGSNSNDLAVRFSLADVL